jgi:hypothetical protein
LEKIGDQASISLIEIASETSANKVFAITDERTFGIISSTLCSVKFGTMLIDHWWAGRLLFVLSLLDSGGGKFIDGLKSVQLRLAMALQALFWALKEVYYSRWSLFLWFSGFQSRNIIPFL